jgi:hypothetical protein
MRDAIPASIQQQQWMDGPPIHGCSGGGGDDDDDCKREASRLGIGQLWFLAAPDTSTTFHLPSSPGPAVDVRSY